MTCKSSSLSLAKQLSLSYTLPYNVLPELSIQTNWTVRVSLVWSSQQYLLRQSKVVIFAFNPCNYVPSDRLSMLYLKHRFV
jgi:hypothetical protein